MRVTVIQAAVVVAVVIAAILAIARFEVLCLRDLDQTDDSELLYLTRPAWTAAILLIIPLGGIAYLYYGKPR